MIGTDERTIIIEVTDRTLSYILLDAWKRILHGVSAITTTDEERVIAHEEIARLEGMLKP